MLGSERGLGGSGEECAASGLVPSFLSFFPLSLPDAHEPLLGAG